MELTITQSSALYLAQHRISNRRSQFFRRLRIAGRDRSLDRSRRTFRRAPFAPRFHGDNGR
jgi:hypothetical protein